jgi:CHAT domain-containing protein
MDETLQWLWTHLLRRPVKQLKAWACARATWVATGFLGMLPLHAAWRPKNGRRRYALDEVAFAYAPSARAVAHVQQASAGLAADDLFAVDNPDGSLRYSGDEVDAVVRHFTAPDSEPWIARREQATVATVRNALAECNVVHLSCHGQNDWRDPLQSALGLYGANWTVHDLFALEKPIAVRLAFLSACETGLPGTDLPDEAVGWASSLIQAGAAGVISTLWSVDERSTAELVSRFYDNWKGGGLAPVDALAEAQRWLRDNGGAIACSEPYHWAGFVLMGV